VASEFAITPEEAYKELKVSELTGKINRNNCLRTVEVAVVKL
jgi:hypothetical protein